MTTPGNTINARLLPDGQARLTLPCGHVDTMLSAEEVQQGQAVDKGCLACQTMFQLCPVPDRVLEIIGSYSRNEPGQLFVLILQQRKLS